MRKKTLLIVVVIFIFIAMPVAFFFLTTKMATPATMTLVAPKTEGRGKNLSKLENTITLWLLSGDKIYAYTGNDSAGGKKYEYKEIRAYLIQQKKQNGDSISVVIKKSEFATYKNTVDILDEMTINNIKNFSLFELSKDEEKLVENLNQRN